MRRARPPLFLYTSCRVQEQHLPFSYSQLHVRTVCCNLRLVYSFHHSSPLYSLWAVLRNIQSATVCLPNRKNVKKKSGQKYLQLPTTIA
jgi:hypothetical protein